jgi:hypothetical protein
MGRNQELDWGKALYNKKAILLLFFFSKEFLWVFLTYHHNFLCIIIIHILSGLGLFFEIRERFKLQIKKKSWIKKYITDDMIITLFLNVERSDNFLSDKIMLVFRYEK